MNVVFVNVELFIGSENVAVGATLSATPVAPLAGVIAITVGGVVSGAANVVKVQLTLAANALFARSRTPVVIVARYCVLFSRLPEGVNVAVLALIPTAPLTGAPELATTRVNVEVVSVALLIGSENVAIGAILSATPVAPLIGDVASTVGGVVSGGGAVVNDQLKADTNALPAASRAPVVMDAVY